MEWNVQYSHIDLAGVGRPSADHRTQEQVDLRPLIYDHHLVWLLHSLNAVAASELDGT
jgi:hypothetical protein